MAKVNKNSPKELERRLKKSVKATIALQKEVQAAESKTAAVINSQDTDLASVKALINQQLHDDIASRIAVIDFDRTEGGNRAQLIIDELQEPSPDLNFIEIAATDILNDNMANILAETDALTAVELVQLQDGVDELDAL
jgi:ABC-type phosphate transport system auxiliary subunit